ncbi:MAG: zinc ABC transporter substrate-binding protein [Herpetosiphonaceae bacterium]|nr:zinc ABC transporter substrate-binding protein [Herpetosiphonaceae bacterium]
MPKRRGRILLTLSLVVLLTACGGATATSNATTAATSAAESATSAMAPAMTTEAPMQTTDVPAMTADMTTATAMATTAAPTVAPAMTTDMTTATTMPAMTAAASISTMTDTTTATSSSVMSSTTTAMATSGAAGNVLHIVAGENFWGSIATQLGGTHAALTSIVLDPNTDPHEYESNTNDARAFAQADYVILNGGGYDDWGQKLLDANAAPKRKVFTVATLLGKKEGDNPHFWYNPTYVEQVADQITADYKALDPADADYFTQQRTAFATALKPFHDRIAAIKAAYSKQKVGATESIFVYFADALGLDLISPSEFMQAVAEGNDPPVSTMAEFQRQVTQKQITVLVYNVQAGSAVTTNLKQLANDKQIPVVGISETLQPPEATFQDWQDTQLQAIQKALAATAPHK